MSMPQPAASAADPREILGDSGRIVSATGIALGFFYAKYPGAHARQFIQATAFVALVGNLHRFHGLNLFFQSDFQHQFLSRIDDQVAAYQGGIPKIANGDVLPACRDILKPESPFSVGIGAFWRISIEQYYLGPS